MTEPVVIDVLDSHGRVASRQRLTLDADRRSFTVGRGVAAEVMLDDPYVAALHVAIAISPEGQISATDLGSVNGIIVNGERYAQAQALALADGRLQVGRTALRVHTVQQPLAEEKPDHAVVHAAPVSAARVAILGGLACAGFICYFAWVAAPRDTVTIIVSSLIGSMVTSGIWIAFWSLLSRVTKGESRWVVHTAVLFGVSAGLLAIDWLIDVAQFAFALPQWPMRNNLLLIAAAALVLYLHLTQVWSATRRRTFVFAALLPVVAFGTFSWVQARNQDRDVNYIGVREQVFPPVLRLREGSSVAQFFDGAARLQDEADKKRKAIPASDVSDPSDED